MLTAIIGKIKRLDVGGTLCTFIYNEVHVVHYYLNSVSNVYSCLLDASKAFDRVHYGTLFTVLLTKCVPMCAIRLVLDSYTLNEKHALNGVM